MARHDKGVIWRPQLRDNAVIPMKMPGSREITKCWLKKHLNPQFTLLELKVRLLSIKFRENLLRILWFQSTQMSFKQGRRTPTAR